MTAINTKTKTVQVSTWRNIVSTCIRIAKDEATLDQAKQTISHQIASILVDKMKGKGETMDRAKDWFKDQCAKHLPKGDKKAHLDKVANRLKDAVIFVPYLESGVSFEKPLTKKQALLVNGHATSAISGKELSEMRGEDWAKAYQDMRKQFGVDTLKKQMAAKGTNDESEEVIDIDLFFDTARVGLATARKTANPLEKAKDHFTDMVDLLPNLSKQEVSFLEAHMAKRGYKLVKA